MLQTLDMSLCKLFLLFFIGQTFLAHGQTGRFFLMLKDTSGYPVQDILFQTKYVDSTHSVVIFLTNRTDSVAPIKLIGGRLNVTTEVQDSNSVWQDATQYPRHRPYIGCGNSFSNQHFDINLPPNAYTYVKKNIPDSGELKTQTRFKLTYRDTVFVSPNYPTSVHKWFFEPHFAWHLQEYEQWKKTLILPQSIDLKNLSTIGQIALFKTKELTNVWEFYKAIEEKYGIYPRLSHLKATTLIKKGASYHKENKNLYIAYICAALNELSYIPSNDDLWERKLDFENRFKPFLLTKQEYLDSNLDCKENAIGEVHCFIKTLINDYVKMHFKEE